MNGRTYWEGMDKIAYATYQSDNGYDMLNAAIGAREAGEEDRERGAMYGAAGGRAGGAIGGLGGGAVGGALGGLGALAFRKRLAKAKIPGSTVATAGMLAGMLGGGTAGRVIGAKKGGKKAREEGKRIRARRLKEQEVMMRRVLAQKNKTAGVPRYLKDLAAGASLGDIRRMGVGKGGMKQYMAQRVLANRSGQMTGRMGKISPAGLKAGKSAKEAVTSMMGAPASAPSRYGPKPFPSQYAPNIARAIRRGSLG